jgi:probable rRNA maturation factor
MKDPLSNPLLGNPSGEPDGVTVAGEVSEADARWLVHKLIELRRIAAPDLRRFAVRVIRDPEMCAMHLQHMNDPTTTDVLTFPDEDGADIAVCVDEACRRAEEMGHEVRRELLLYALHGMLHCVGFDDTVQEDHDRMHAEEDRLLGLVGVKSTFSRMGGTEGAGG